MGNTFYQRHAPAGAVRLYRESLAVRFTPATAANLAWILATSADPTLRDGPAALELAQRALATNGTSYHFTSALAAACAELGLFRDAVAQATRALELARANREPASIGNAEARLQAYEAQRPWRQ